MEPLLHNSNNSGSINDDSRFSGETVYQDGYELTDDAAVI